jgi:SAM-dependent methyltransferase
MHRNSWQKFKDFITFPLRAVSLFDDNHFGLSSLRTERFDYVAREVRGFCLDVGCGRNNRFIRETLAGNGKGIDVFAYEGLEKENIVKDITHFPFDDDLELAEACRCLRPGGNIIVTMGNPLAELLVHRLVAIYDRLFKTNIDVDTERGMEEEEEYYLTDAEIHTRLERAGFRRIHKKYFGTQWGLNALFVGWKD